MPRLRVLFTCAAWLLASFIVVSSVSPISFRPHLATLSPDFERFAAFFGVTLAFILAYPARRVAIMALMVASAVALEVAQNFVPGRHGMASDAVVKLLGTGLALCVTLVAQHMFSKSDVGGGE